MQSIHKFLLVYLLLTVTITTTVTAVCNYYLDQRDIQEHHDTLMAISAISYQSLLGDDLEQRPLQKIQKSLNNIPKQIVKYYPKSLFYSNLPNYYLDRFNFQVWNANDKLLLHSAGNPLIDNPYNTQGFSDIIIDQEKWRTFTTYNPKARFHTVLAEKYETRFELGHRIALDELYIIFLTFPISGLLIWVVVGKGLKSLDSVAKEIANRKANNLDPLIVRKAPTELKPLIDELNMLLQRLKDGFERETRFAADAAHELRTPLAALKAQAQVALHTSDINEKNAALQKVIASVNRNTHIVQQLLTLSKLAPEDSINSNWKPINLNSIAKEVIAILAPNAIEDDVELEFFGTHDIESFMGNPTSIEVLIKNLVENAIHYCNNNGRVTIKTSQDDKNIILEVADNGPGIPLELRKRVFERFYRVLGNKKSGSGLGLAIVQEIINMHHAKIELDTPAQGNGLIIRVFFGNETLHVRDNK